MRIAVLGATGRTGTLVTQQALERGHQVAALARDPSALAIDNDRLTTAAVDVLEPEGLRSGLEGSDAVISTLGAGTSRAPTTVYSQGITNVLEVMDACGIRRLAVVSAAPVAPRAGQPFLEGRILMPILDRVFGATYADMRRMESILQDSMVTWVSLRPPRLVKKAGKGRYRLSTSQPLPKARSLTYSDLARALLDTVERDDLRATTAFVAN